MWFYLIFAALSVIGGIFGKKKKDKADAAKREQQRSAPRARRQPPTPPRPPELARPTRPIAPAEARRAHAPAVLRTPTRQPRPRPGPPRSRTIEARPSQPRQPLGFLRATLGEPELLTAEVVAEAPAGERMTTLPSDMLSPAVTAKPPTRHPGTEAARVRRLLQSRAGLRVGFILHEILAPPVGLRDNPQV
jgi:hypothetical protein